MKYCQASPGRIFVLRLEQGEIVHEILEQFAEKQNITSAALIAVGGVDTGSTLVIGPEDGTARPVHPMHHVLDNVHEVAGVGTLFPDKDGQPVVHMHMACGRKEATITGCIRSGVVTWQVLEIILMELVDCSARRMPDAATGFALLEPAPDKIR